MPDSDDPRRVIAEAIWNRQGNSMSLDELNADERKEWEVDADEAVKALEHEGYVITHKDAGESAVMGEADSNRPTDRAEPRRHDSPARGADGCARLREAAAAVIEGAPEYGPFEFVSVPAAEFFALRDVLVQVETQ